MLLPALDFHPLQRDFHREVRLQRLFSIDGIAVSWKTTQWEAVEKGDYWAPSNLRSVVCSDGTIYL